jgi:hypothetical protein
MEKDTQIAFLLILKWSLLQRAESGEYTVSQNLLRSLFNLDPDLGECSSLPILAMGYQFVFPWCCVAKLFFCFVNTFVGRSTRLYQFLVAW